MLVTLTVQEAVVLEAAAAEERVEGVHGLVARHALGERPVDVGRALGRQRVGVAAGRQLDVPDGELYFRKRINIPCKKIKINGNCEQNSRTYMSEGRG